MRSRKAATPAFASRSFHAPSMTKAGQRLVVGEDDLDRLTDAGQLGGVERRLPVDRREAGRGQHHVAVAQGDVEVLGEVQDHLAARLRPAGLDEREMPRRHAGQAGEVELAHAALRSPHLQELAEPRRCRRDGRHGSDGTRATVTGPLPQRESPSVGRRSTHAFHADNRHDTDNHHHRSHHRPLSRDVERGRRRHPRRAGARRSSPTTAVWSTR